MNPHCLPDTSMALDVQDIERLNVNDPRIDIAYEWWTLDTYLSVVEEHLPISQKRYRLRAKGLLERRVSGLHSGEISFEDAKIDDTTDKQIPRFFRAGALLSVWAFFESSVIDVVRYVDQRANTELYRADRRKFLSWAKKCFEGELKIGLPWNREEEKKLRHLQDLRHCLAHSNGRLLNFAPQKEREKIGAIVSAESGVRIEDEEIIINASYIRESAKLICVILKRLTKLIADRFNDPPISDAEIALSD